MSSFDGLTGVEAQVLEHGDLAGLKAVHGVVGGGADGVLGEGHRGVQELTEALGGGQQGEDRVRGALGAAQVGGDEDLGAGVREGLDGGQYGPDAAVVGDDPVGQRHVQVGADEDPLAVDSFSEEFVDRLHEGDS